MDNDLRQENMCDIRQSLLDAAYAASCDADTHEVPSKKTFERTTFRDEDAMRELLHDKKLLDLWRVTPNTGHAIERREIEEALEDGVARIDTPPMGIETVCWIGDMWFFFAGEEGDMSTPADYLRDHPLKGEGGIADEVTRVLAAFEADDDTADEWSYYRSVTNETQTNP